MQMTKAFERFSLDALDGVDVRNYQAVLICKLLANLSLWLVQ